MLHKALFPQLMGKKWVETNLNDMVKEMLHGRADGPNPVLDPVWWFENEKELRKRLGGAAYFFGGYMEDRSFLWRGHYLAPGQMTHYGVDYSVPHLTPVFLPKTGRLLLLEQGQDNRGGWGGRAIYQIGDLYVTFAHLFCLTGPVGCVVEAGSLIGLVASHLLNGGWAPHLHVQCMRNYDLMVDGYGRPGQEAKFPNPEKVLA